MSEWQSRNGEEQRGMESTHDRLEGVTCDSQLHEARDWRLLSVLFNERAITELQTRYGRVCDDGYSPEELASMFVEDGVWERTLGERGTERYVGRAQIAANFTQASQTFPWALHIVAPAGIEIDAEGKSATGHWRLFMPCIQSKDGSTTAAWMAGRYRNDYVLHDGRWYFKHVRMQYELRAAVGYDWSRGLLKLP